MYFRIIREYRYQRAHALLLEILHKVDAIAHKSVLILI